MPQINTLLKLMLRHPAAVRPYLSVFAGGFGRPTTKEFLKSYCVLLKKKDPVADFGNDCGWLPAREAAVVAVYPEATRLLTATFIEKCLSPLLADRVISAEMKPNYSGSTGKLITKGVAVALAELAGTRSKCYAFTWEDSQGVDLPSLWSVRGRMILLLDYLVGVSKDPKAKPKEGFGKKLFDRLELPEGKTVIP